MMLIKVHHFIIRVLIAPEMCEEKKHWTTGNICMGKLHFKYLTLNMREVVFKFFHRVLPNKHRLK